MRVHVLGHEVTSQDMHTLLEDQDVRITCDKDDGATACAMLCFAHVLHAYCSLAPACNC
jgi:hypothetical protein